MYANASERPPAHPNRSLIAMALLATAATVPLLVYGIRKQNINFPAHSFLWSKPQMLVHSISDGLIALACLLISATLAYLVFHARRTIPFSGMLLAFGIFILANGVTHALEIVTLWKPVYLLLGDAKIITALASVVTAIALPALVPKILKMLEERRISESQRLKLLQSEARFREIFEAAGIGLGTADVDGRVLSCNPSFQKMLGYSAEELVGMNIRDFAITEDAASDLKDFGELVSGKINQYSVDKRYRRKNGQLIWVHIVASLVRPQGEKPYTMALIENITDRVNAAETEKRLLAESKVLEARRVESLAREARFRAVFEAAGIGVSTADLTGKMLSANPSWRKMMGYSNDEISNLNFWQLSHPDDIPAHRKLFQELILGKIPQYQLVKRFYRKSGEPLWCRTTVSLVHSLEKPSYVVKVVENITEQRFAAESEKKLIKEQAARNEAEDNLALLNSVLQCMPAGVAIVEKSGKVLLMNKQLKAISEHAAGSSNSDSGPHSSLLSLLQHSALTTAIETGEVLEQQEVSFAREEGDEGILRISAAPVYDREGKIVAAVTTAYDITESRKAEEALRTSEKLASVGRLAATIAHEINNPLESVTNILYLLNTHASVGSEPKQLVEMAQQELGRVIHIVRQTLGFYRESTSPVPVSITEVMDDVLGLYSRKFEETRATVARHFAQVPRVDAFPGEMRQVFSNLMVNALDAIGNDGKGRIAIKVSRSSDRRFPERKGVRVLISDNGAGIPPDNRKRIFEPFFSTKGEKGTGLGLWVCYGIIQKHCGSIHVHSSQNSGRPGTSFSVFIPDEASSKAKAA